MMARRGQLKIIALVVLGTIGFVGIAVEAHASQTMAPRIVVKRQILAKYSQLEKELRKKQAQDRAELLSSLERDSSSESLRMVQKQELEERHRLQRHWLSHQRAEELCTLAREKCESLAVRDMSSDVDTIPEYARDSGFVYEQ